MTEQECEILATAGAELREIIARVGGEYTDASGMCEPSPVIRDLSHVLGQLGTLPLENEPDEGFSVKVHRMCAMGDGCQRDAVWTKGDGVWWCDRHV